jgi:hypothetical protein
MPESFEHLSDDELLSFASEIISKPNDFSKADLWDLTLINKEFLRRKRERETSHG